MGCDIHLYVERRVNGVWESADVWTLEPEYEDNLETVPYEDQYYRGRNYLLFAVLANVRNPRGVPPPIANPRGLPDDITEKPRRISESEPEFFHSRSWVTLAELLEYDWTIIIQNGGLLTAGDFAEWIRWVPDKRRPPRARYYSMIMRFKNKEPLVTVTESEMVALLTEINPEYPNWSNPREVADIVKESFPNHYVQCTWKEPLHNLTADFWSETMPRLLRFGKPEDVRIVFWFDN